jgi:hypothetical protein
VSYVAGLAGALAWNQRFPEWLDFLARAATPGPARPEGPGFPSVLLEGAPHSLQLLTRRTVDGDLAIHLLNRSGEMERPIRRILPLSGIRLRLPGLRAADARALRAGLNLETRWDGADSVLNLPELGAYEVVTVGAEGGKAKYSSMEDGYGNGSIAACGGWAAASGLEGRRCGGGGQP